MRDIVGRGERGGGRERGREGSCAGAGGAGDICWKIVSLSIIARMEELFVDKKIMF